jgi:hypothetical protein
VLWHTEVEGQKPADVAPLLGMSANAVSALAYRAREGLRQAFLTQHAAELDGDTCRWTHQHLGAYIRSGLSRRDTGKVEDHLQDCRSCMAVYLELTEVNSNLAGILAPVLLGGAAAGYLSGGAATKFSLVALLDQAREWVGANTQVAAASSAAAVVTIVAGTLLVVTANDDPPRRAADPGIEAVVPGGSEGARPRGGDDRAGRASVRQRVSARQSAAPPVADVAPTPAPDALVAGAPGGVPGDAPADVPADGPADQSGDPSTGPNTNEPGEQPGGDTGEQPPVEQPPSGEEPTPGEEEPPPGEEEPPGEEPTEPGEPVEVTVAVTSSVTAQGQSMFVDVEVSIADSSGAPAEANVEVLATGTGLNNMNAPASQGGVTCSNAGDQVTCNFTGSHATFVIHPVVDPQELLAFVNLQVNVSGAGVVATTTTSTITLFPLTGE